MKILTKMYDYYRSYAKTQRNIRDVEDKTTVFSSLFLRLQLFRSLSREFWKHIFWHFSLLK